MDFLNFKTCFPFQNARMSSSGGGSVSMEDQQPQTYCLKWNNHQSNLLGLFARLFASEQFTDVVVTAEGRSIRAHKVRTNPRAKLHFYNLLTGSAYIQFRGCMIPSSWPPFHVGTRVDNFWKFFDHQLTG